MKNILIVNALLIAISCKAQNPPIVPIVPLETNHYDAPQDAYFKDMNNEMDKYVGTWKYTGGTTEFVIVIQKKEMVPDDGKYEDILIGEYKYIENGIELINTLPLLNDPSIIGGYHNISGRRIIYPNSAYSDCTNCDPNEKRFQLHFDDPDRVYLPLIIVLQYLEEYTPPRLKVSLLSTDSIVLPDENSPDESRVPLGEYVLVKQ